MRGKSSADFIAKMGIVEEECDESVRRMNAITRSIRSAEAISA